VCLRLVYNVIYKAYRTIWPFQREKYTMWCVGVLVELRASHSQCVILEPCVRLICQHGQVAVSQISEAHENWKTEVVPHKKSISFIPIKYTLMHCKTLWIKTSIKCISKWKKWSDVKYTGTEHKKRKLALWHKIMNAIKALMNDKVRKCIFFVEIKALFKMFSQL